MSMSPRHLWPDRIRTIAPRIAAFVRDELIPLETLLLRRKLDALFDALEAKRDRVREEGWWAPQLPESLGGMGLSLPEFAHIAEILGGCAVAHYAFNCQAPDAGNMEILADHASPAQRDRWLMPLVRGELRSCFAMTEPERAGSNPVWLGTTARRVGAEYVIDGQKWFATAADGAAFAIVMAVTDPHAERPHERASMIIVPTDAPGYRHVRRIPVMGDEGAGWASHSELRFEGCRVPLENRLGDEGAGFRIAQERLGPGRIHHCMRWIGICERAFDLLCRRAIERETAPGQPLAKREMVRHWVAESRAEINGARLMVLDAAGAIDRDGPAVARTEISLIKFHVADILQRVLDRAIQVHGALGMTDDTILAFWYRHERAARIYDGPDEVHKLAAARAILREYQDGLA